MITIVSNIKFQMSYNEVNRKWLQRQYYESSITIVTVLFSGYQTNIPHSIDVYNPEYVDKLYRGVARNFRGTFDFICLTDQNYKFKEPIIQNRLSMLIFQAWNTTLVLEIKSSMTRY